MGGTRNQCQNGPFVTNGVKVQIWMLSPRRTTMGKPPADQWWTINGQDMLDALIRCHNGDDPDIVYLELFVNSDVTDYGEDNDDSH
jgi:hypothetical protein